MATPYVTIPRNVVPSTQEVAVEEMLAAGTPALVVAQSQTAGRGRSGNEWWQAPRATAASLAFLADTFDVGETLPLAVGLAVRQAIAKVLMVEVDLKWPNDLEYSGRKVGGVLVERDEQRVVIGCGLNLYWPDPPAIAGALLRDDPGPDVGEEVARSWASRILASAGRWDRDEYLDAFPMVGAEVTWVPDGHGFVETVDLRGGLVVATGDGIVTLRSGEVRTVRSLSDDA